MKYFKHILLVLLLILIVIQVNYASAEEVKAVGNIKIQEENTSENTTAEAVEKPIDPLAELEKQAYTAFLKRKNIKQTKISMDLYKELVEKDPNNIEYWDYMLRMIWWYGAHIKKKDDNRLNIFHDGLSRAKEMIKKHPKEPKAHMWKGALLGSWALEKGLLKALTQLKEIKRSFEKSMELDQNFLWGDRLIGRCYRDAPGWPLSYGDNDKAIEYFEKAMKKNPADLRNQLDLAISFNKDKKYEEALKWAQEVIDKPMTKNLEVELIEAKQQAKEIIEVIKSKI